MLVKIANLKTIKDYLNEEFLKQSDPDLSIKICTCIEVVDLLTPNNFGHIIDYDKELKISEVKTANKKIKKNSIEY